MDVSTTPARHRSRIAGIEGLRALAAAAIVVMHAFTVLAPAGLLSRAIPIQILSRPLVDGVTLFFVLSGFLLWRPVASAIAGGRTLPSVRRYARNRALRILPAYWAVLAVSALVLASVRLVPLSTPPLVGALHDPPCSSRTRFSSRSSLRERCRAASSRPGRSRSRLRSTSSSRCSDCSPRGLQRGRRRGATASPPRSRPQACSLLVALAGKLVATFVVPGPEGAFRNTWHSVLDRSFLTHADLFAAGMLVAVLHVEHANGRLRSRRACGRVRNCTLVYAIPVLFLSYYAMPRYVEEPLSALLFALSSPAS